MCKDLMQTIGWNAWTMALFFPLVPQNKGLRFGVFGDEQIAHIQMNSEAFWYLGRSIIHKYTT